MICIRNGRYAESQMFDSACIGFSHIAEKCSRVFFTPVDIPLFSADTLVEMQKHDAPLVYPVFKGNRGHPVLISCGILPDIMASGAHGGLREAFSRYADTAVLVDADEGTVYDADTPEEFERLLKLYEKLNDRQD